MDMDMDTDKGVYVYFCLAVYDHVGLVHEARNQRSRYSTFLQRGCILPTDYFSFHSLLFHFGEKEMK